MSYIPTVGFLITAVMLFFNDHPIAGGWSLFIAWCCVPPDPITPDDTSWED